MRWTDGATEQQKEAMIEALLGLREKIDVVRDMRLGSDLGVRPENFDFAVAVDFDTPEDYLHYREHPAHMEVVRDLIQPVMAERAGIVFEHR